MEEDFIALVIAHRGKNDFLVHRELRTTSGEVMASGPLHSMEKDAMGGDYYAECLKRPLF
jgi:hypothetical protein